jgi:predicted AAA+ superfamily ATPase
MFIERPNYREKIEEAISRLPIVILTGARQVGKTTLMKNHPVIGPVLSINGENIETSDLFQKYSILISYLKLNLNESLSGTLFIDEFQYIPGIDIMLKLLADDHPSLKIICTGSSSLTLSQHISESLAGRIRIVEIFPLSFEEYLGFNSPELHTLFSKYDENTPDLIVDGLIAQKLSEHILYGGLPRVALEKDVMQKILLLDDIVKTYLLKDVRSYIRNEDSVGFNRLLRILSAQISNLVNVNELSRSTGLSYKKCEEYLYLLEQMYVIRLVEPFQSNFRKTVTKMRKLYFLDTGLRNMIYNSFNDLEIRIDNGALFENYIYQELIKNQSVLMKIFYYRTLDGSEIDFIVQHKRDLFPAGVKFKHLGKPSADKGLTAFNRAGSVRRSYYFNRNLNTTYHNIHFIQGYLAGKVGWE